MSELVKKLRIKEGHQVLLLNPPSGYGAELLLLPEDARLEVLTAPETNVRERVKEGADALLLFVHGIEELESWAPVALSAITPEGLLWIAYPKQSSKIKTDLNRDKGWEPITRAGYEGVAMISIDATWSAVRFRPVELVKSTRSTRASKSTSTAAAAEAKAPEERVVTVPEDMQAALAQRPEALAFFEQLSYTNRKEYVRWVTEAKREETRNSRIQKTLERLQLGLKNPWVKS